MRLRPFPGPPAPFAAPFKALCFPTRNLGPMFVAILPLSRRHFLHSRLPLVDCQLSLPLSHPHRRNHFKDDAVPEQEKTSSVPPPFARRHLRGLPRYGRKDMTKGCGIYQALQSSLLPPSARLVLPSAELVVENLNVSSPGLARHR